MQKGATTHLSWPRAVTTSTARAAQKTGCVSALALSSSDETVFVARTVHPPRSAQRTMSTSRWRAPKPYSLRTARPPIAAATTDE